MARRRRAFLTLIALIGAAPSFAREPRIVEKAIPGGYKISIVGFTGADQNVAQAMITPTVQRLCGSLTPQWGRFTLNAMIANRAGKPLKPGRFEQEIRCIASPIADASGPTPPFEPTAADERLSRDTALKFLRLRDAGNAKASFAMLTASMQQTTDRVAWASNARNAPRMVGGDVARKIVNVTWYVDPPGVPAGVYAAADFEGTSSMLAVHCGYVALLRQSNGEFLVTRTEEGRLRASDAKTMSAEQLQQTRVALQCRG